MPILRSGNYCFVLSVIFRGKCPQIWPRQKATHDAINKYNIQGTPVSFFPESHVQIQTQQPYAPFDESPSVLLHMIKIQILSRRCHPANRDQVVLPVTLEGFFVVAVLANEPIYLLSSDKVGQNNICSTFFV